MEKCKFCQADLAENGTFCPVCGKDNSEAEVIEETVAAEEVVTEEATAEEVVTEEATAEVVVAEEAAAEETPTEETIAAQEEAFAEGATKKTSPAKIAIAVVAVVVLAAILIALLVGGMGGKEMDNVVPGESTDVTETTPPATIPPDGNPDDQTCKGTYTASDEEVIAAADTVVATAGDYQLTNSELQIYYWLEVQSFLQNYGTYAYYMGLDYTQPLDMQVCTMTETSCTWQQFFLANALNSWQNYQSMAGEADANGYALSAENQEYIDTLEQNLADSAAANGFASPEELLAYNVGNGSTIADYVKFNRDYLKGYEYYQAMTESIELTEEEIAKHFEDNKEAYAQQELTEEDVYVNVRHILFTPQGGTVAEDGSTTYSEEEWEAARAEAQAILDEWLAGDKTEEHFAELANTYTDDGNDANYDGIPDGGLYTDVYEGQMVPEFEEWCFDASRQTGDSGLVKTTYGYHVMYYVSDRPAWKDVVRNELMNERIALMSEEIKAKYPLTVDYSSILLGFVDMNA